MSFAVFAVAGCAETIVSASPELGSSNLVIASARVENAVEVSGQWKLGTRTTANCGVQGSNAFGQKRVPRPYVCSVTAASAYVLGDGLAPLSDIQGLERSMLDSGCSVMSPVSGGVDEQRALAVGQGVLTEPLAGKYTCGNTRVLVYLSRADSRRLQEKNDQFSATGGGTDVRQEPPLALETLSRQLYGSNARALVAVVMSSVTYLRVNVCAGLEICDANGRPSLPETPLPMPSDLPSG